MEDNLENRLSMYQKVQGALSIHSAATASIPAIATLSTQLDSKVNSILAMASKADTDITGYTVDKQAKRTDLKTKILKLAGGVVAFTAISEDFKTVEKCDATPSQMDYMRDNDFYAYAKLVLNEVTPLMSSLTPFGVVVADLNAANISADYYLKVIQSPKNQINERSNNKKALTVLFEETSELLEKKLDKVMGVFITTNPNLFNAYIGARSIDDTGAAVEPDYEKECSANTVFLIAELPYLKTRGFKFENTGSVPLHFALSAKEDTLEGTVLTLDPGIKSTRSTNNLNPNALATKLYVQNPDVVLGGSFKVWVLE